MTYTALRLGLVLVLVCFAGSSPTGNKNDDTVSEDTPEFPPSAWQAFMRALSAFMNKISSFMRSVFGGNKTDKTKPVEGNANRAENDTPANLPQEQTPEVNPEVPKQNADQSEAPAQVSEGSDVTTKDAGETKASPQKEVQGLAPAVTEENAEGKGSPAQGLTVGSNSEVSKETADKTATSPEEATGGINSDVMKQNDAKTAPAPPEGSEQPKPEDLKENAAKVVES